MYGKLHRKRYKGGESKMKGFIIDCDYLIHVIDYLPKDEFEIVEMPIISIDTGLWSLITW